MLFKYPFKRFKVRNFISHLINNKHHLFYVLEKDGDTSILMKDGYLKNKNV